MGQTVKNLPAVQETRVQSLGSEDSLEKEWLPTPVFLPGKFHGQRSLVGCNPRGRNAWATNTITLLFVFLFFPFIFISWSLITLQYCSGFCHTLQNRKRDTDVQNRLLDSVGEGKGGMFWENSIETSILSRVKPITSPGWMHETGAQGWCTGSTITLLISLLLFLHIQVVHFSRCARTLYHFYSENQTNRQNNIN